MGMDFIELIMELEDEFELNIPDEAATELTTVGATIDYVVRALRGRNAAAGACPTARSFYRLRQSLVARCEVRREAVRLDTPIGQLVPSPLRREWPQVASEAGLRAERPRLFRAPFPPPEMSVARLLDTRCRDRFQRYTGDVDEAAVERRVLEMVSERTAVPVAKLRRESHYFKDLNLE